jgi:glycopeptide antibiotics resistance protein
MLTLRNSGVLQSEGGRASPPTQMPNIGESDHGQGEPVIGDESPTSERSGARLGGAVLAYMLCVTLTITLLPFHFSWPTHWRVMTSGGPLDVVANVLLFIPLGALFRAATRLSRRHAVIGALAAGLLMSMAIEALQLFEPERYSSVVDVVANSAGAWIGSLIYGRISRQKAIDVEMIGRLFLELPLMGLLYLTIPLLWLTALVATAAPAWAWLAVPLAAYAGVLLGGVLRHLGTGVALTPLRGGLFAAGGIVVGMFPALITAPVAIAASALVAFAVTQAAATQRGRPFMWNRRFEVAVLRSSAPFYALFLALIVLLPLKDGVAQWSLGVGFPGVADSWDKAEILRFLVRVASFTLLGYMIAEYRGREEERLRDAVPRVLRWTIAAATAAEVVLGYRAGRGASVAQWGFVVVASLYGGWLYRLQRAHVVAVLRDTKPVEPVPTDF